MDCHRPPPIVISRFRLHSLREQKSCIGCRRHWTQSSWRPLKTLDGTGKHVKAINSNSYCIPYTPLYMIYYSRFSLVKRWRFTIIFAFFSEVRRPVWSQGTDKGSRNDRETIWGTIRGSMPNDKKTRKKKDRERERETERARKINKILNKNTLWRTKIKKKTCSTTIHTMIFTRATEKNVCILSHSLTATLSVASISRRVSNASFHLKTQYAKKERKGIQNERAISTWK